ncbi:MAG: glycosyltransferase [Planctomycetes bacterium]|nr:glycosyltransferase [Planctomycetota bacterium]
MNAPLTVAPFPAALAANPYCTLLYRGIEQAGARIVRDGQLDTQWLRRHRGAVDVLHFHWIDSHYQHWRGGPFSLLTLAKFAHKLFLARSLGYKIVWTMHNFAPHDSKSPLADGLARWLMLHLGSVVVHCQYAKSLIANGNGRSVSVIPHGNYMGWHPNQVTKEEARKRLGLPSDAKVFLTFGLMRGYKGHTRLVNDFKRLGRDDAHLLVVGANYDDCEKMTRGQVETDGHVHYHRRFVPDDEVQVYFNAADFAVFPFEKVLTSGAVILSLSFGRPVIVPRLGCLGEMENSGAALVYDPADEDGLLSALRKGMDLDAAKASERAFRIARALDWTMIAEKHLRVYTN